MFDGKKILITGGTGSLGFALTIRLLETTAERIRIYSRDEWKQTQMQSTLTDKRLRFFIGDVRDKERLFRALEDIDIVIHAAALKQVPVAEYNPFEAVKTNIYGTQNLIEACLDRNVEHVVAIGTDKAVAPLNTYGATKHLMERLIISANNYIGQRKIRFTCVRYGNVLGSRGSVVPIFVNQCKTSKKITITDPDMTRFTITVNEATSLILRAIETGIGGEVFIPKLKAFRMGDMKDAIIELLAANSAVERIPIRPGEKFHESLIVQNELRNTFEDEQDYIIFEKQPFIEDHDIARLKNVTKTTRTEEYSSDKVPLLSKEELKEILIREKLV